jgi:hypothetical protein
VFCVFFGPFVWLLVVASLRRLCRARKLCEIWRSEKRAPLSALSAPNAKRSKLF